MGMAVTTISGSSSSSNLTCVSLDIESAFSVFKPEIQTFLESQVVLSPNIPEVLL